MTDSRDDDVGRLLELIGWARDKLDRLHDRTSDIFVRRNLHAVRKALDAENNPRLKPIAVRHKETGKPGERPSLTQHQRRVAAAHTDWRERDRRGAG